MSSINTKISTELLDHVIKHFGNFRAYKTYRTTIKKPQKEQTKGTAHKYRIA